MVVYLIPFFVCMALAMLYQLKWLRLDRTFYFLALLAVAIFAGLRFEVGQDWSAYEKFFNELDLRQGPFDERTTFEIGYYLLNYAVKWLGGSYSAVFLTASFFCSYAVYRFTSPFTVNRFYILTIYFGYSFLILNFAQVRQSIAIGFFLLGCAHYLQHGKKIKALLICLAGPLFQYSSMMYVVLLVGVFMWPKRNLAVWALVICVLGIGALYSVATFSDFFSLIALASSQLAEDKIAIYRDATDERGLGQSLYVVYLFLLACYFLRNLRYLKPEHAFVAKYAVLAIFLTVLFSLIFPGTYAMYSRAYVVACLFHGYAAALIFAARKGLTHRVVFLVTISAAVVSYLQLLNLWGHEYIPYNSLLGSF